MVIETPRRSRNKYAYDPGSGLFVLRGVLPIGMRSLSTLGLCRGRKASSTECNDRLIAQAMASSRSSTPKAIRDLGSDVLSEIEAFFFSYNQIDGKKLKVLRSSGVGRAKSLIKQAMSE